MNYFKSKRVLLTGATGGIGSELAYFLIKEGASVFIPARAGAGLNLLKKSLPLDGAAHFYEFDILSRDSSQILDMVSKANETMGGIDILINCAGVQNLGKLHKQSPTDIDNLMYINATFPISLTGAVLPILISAKTGHIVNIGSVLGFIGMAHYSAYSASKFALRGFSEAIRREVSHLGISVTHIAPRATDTSINNEVARSLAGSSKKMDSPRDVARSILNAIEEKQSEVVIGYPEKLFVAINNVAPCLITMATKSEVISDSARIL